MSEETQVRRLVLLQHAQAAQAPGEDAKRPLSPAGEGEASAAGRWLYGAEISPDLVVCSPALRARQTVALVAGELAARPPVTFDERIYDADTALLALVRETDDAVRTLLLVGHNPGVHRLAYDLTGADGLRDNFPAASLAVVRVSGPWAALASDSAELAAFLPPARL